MQKGERQTLKLIVAGRYSRTSSLSNHNHQQLQSQFKHNPVEDSSKAQEVDKILQAKYRTFMKWDYRQSLQKSPRGRKSANNSNQKLITDNSSANGIVFSPIKPHKIQFQKSNLKLRRLSSNKISKDEDVLVVKQQVKTEGNRPICNYLSPDMRAIKLDRRERFKKFANPIQFLKHYIQKESYSPTSEQKHLIQKLLQIHKSMENQSAMIAEGKASDLEYILQKIYKLMNLTVDYNQLLFLSLLVCLAANICFFLKDYDRAFYFYNQTRIAGSYSKQDRLKIPALIGMARVCLSLQKLQESKRLFRKALQYAWRSNDENSEHQIYDFFGQVLNQQGKIRQSKYYHEKFVNSVVEPGSSFQKKTSEDMLADYDKHIESLEFSNLDSLFLQYIHLPINKAYEVKDTVSPGKTFRNYDEEGQSPRLKKQTYNFSAHNFLDIKSQISNLLTKDYQFKSQIADPDKPNSRKLDRMMMKKSRDDQETQLYSLPKKRQIQFEHTVEFHRIMGIKKSQPIFAKEQSLTLDKKIQQKCKDKLDPRWYQNMLMEVRKRRLEKVGALKERVRNSHMSYHKYPSERKRNAQWSCEKIKQSFNRTILDWIDLIK